MKKRSIAFLLVFTMVLSLVFSVVPQRSVKAAGTTFTLSQADFDAAYAAMKSGSTKPTAKQILCTQDSYYDPVFRFTGDATYVLDGDVNFYPEDSGYSKKLVIDKNITLNLNGHRMDANLEVPGAVTLTVTGSGILNSAADYEHYIASFNVTGNANLVLDGNFTCGGVIVKGGAKVTVNGPTFDSSMYMEGQQGGTRPSLYIKSGVFKYGFTVVRGDLTVDNVTANSRVSIGSSSTAVINNGTFSGVVVRPTVFEDDWDYTSVLGENPGQVTINGGTFNQERYSTWGRDGSWFDALTYGGDLVNPTLTLNGGFFSGYNNGSSIVGGNGAICVYGASSAADYEKLLGTGMRFYPSVETEVVSRNFPPETQINALLSQQELCVMPINAVSGPTIIEGNSLPTFAGRTMSNTAEAYEKAMANSTRDYYEIAPSLTSPYSGGKMNAQSHQAMTDMTNFYRWQSGVKPLSGVSTHSDELQAGALVRNFSMSHWPEDNDRPADFPKDLWDFGAAADHTCLSWGCGPAGSIINWVYDGGGSSAGQGGWSFVGHRATIVGPWVDNLQFGFVDGCAILAVTSNTENGFNEGFSACPGPGYMPKELLGPGSAGWTVYFDQKTIKNSKPNQVQVQVTNLNNGTSYTCTTEAGNLQSFESGLTFMNPSDRDYGDYQVEITGIYDGRLNEAILRYTVHFFSYYDYKAGSIDTSAVDDGVGNDTSVVTPGGNSTVGQVGSDDVPDVLYKTHIQTYGNETVWRANGAMSGTSGESKRLEGIYIQTTGDPELGIQYTTHCQTYGWLPWSSNGEMSGTSGESKRLEAIMIRLTGAHADLYDVYYRVHAQSYGWLGWAKNGAPAGTAGQSKRLEGIQILIVPKNSAIDANVGGISSVRPEPYLSAGGSQPVVGGADTDANNPQIPNADKTTIMYQTHVQTYGWQGWRTNGIMSGTSGESKRLEGIRIKLSNKSYSGGVQYITHVQTYGWQGDVTNPATWKRNGEMAGTSGESKRLESIQINLYGEMADHYDIYYRVHAQTFGWLGWASNGAPAGTAGYSKRLEGIEIVLVEKGGAAPGSTENAFVSK